MADDLRLPVSNLVRNVLEEAFNVVEQVSEDLGGVLEEVMEGAEEASGRYDRYRSRRRGRRSHGRRQRRPEADDDEADDAEDAEFSDESAEAASSAAEAPPSDPFEGIIAWQPVVLHAPQYCARTGRRMEAGERAHAAIGAHGLSGLYVREDALPLD